MIDELYRVFERYERPASFPGCPCGGCWGSSGDLDAAGDVEVPAPGGARPLRLLDEADLENIVATVPATSGDLDVFKHYLPRVLEILAEGGWVDPESDVLVTKKLHEHVVDVRPPWPTWPDEETAAIRRYVDRFHQRILASGRQHDVI